MSLFAHRIVGGDIAHRPAMKTSFIDFGLEPHGCTLELCPDPHDLFERHAGVLIGMRDVDFRFDLWKPQMRAWLPPMQ